MAGNTDFGNHHARYKTPKGGTKEGTLSVERRWGQVHVTLTTKEHITRTAGVFVLAEWFNKTFAKRELLRAGITSWK